MPALAPASLDIRKRFQNSAGNALASRIFCRPGNRELIGHFRAETDQQPKMAV
jgi:hypothetical protein